MFGTILTAAFALLLLYVLFRAASIPRIRRRLTKKGFAILGVCLAAVFFLTQTLGHHGTGPLAEPMEFVGMTLLGLVFLTSTALFIVDLCTLFGRLLPQWRPAARGAGLTAGVALSVFALIQGHRAPAVVSQEVTLKSLPADLDGTVIVAVSDTHIGSRSREKWFQERVAQISALEPDMLVFLGDMFEGHGFVPSDFPALCEMEPGLGKWFVAGNHESHRRHDGEDEDETEQLDESNDGLERAGFRRLSDQWVEPAPGLVVAGVNDLTNHERRGSGGDPLSTALARRPEGATVLLSHTPWQTDRAAKAGVELMLSGHTHGGQIWPFGYLVRIVYPVFVGRYEIGGMTAIVSRGTGTWGPRMRLWHRSEILKITLRAPVNG